MAIDYKKEGRIAVFTINRPEARNALDIETARQLRQAMLDFTEDSELWVAIITGAGDVFCVGADIKDALPFIKEKGPWAFPASPMRGLEIWKPLIAAINGPALGGGLELALACDIRLASDKARLGMPEVTLGLMPGWGGTQRLPRLIPWAGAAEMILLGRLISAGEAYRIGLVNGVVPQDELMAEAGKWAKAICEVGPLAARAAKEAMVRGYSLSLDEGLELENALVAHLMETEDYTEGIGAFLEKRRPVFKAK